MEEKCGGSQGLNWDVEPWREGIDLMLILFL
jgi:hypothetical protein